MFCRRSEIVDYSFDDLLSSVLPVYHNLLESNIKILVFRYVFLIPLWHCEQSLSGDSQSLSKFVDRNTSLSCEWCSCADPLCHGSLVPSGDVDAIVPVTGTRTWLNLLPLNITEAWRPWTVDNQV